MRRIPLAGDHGGHRSTQFSAEVNRNIYLDQSSSGRWGVHDFPGLKAFATTSGNDRGAHVMAGVLYRISGTTLYQVASDGTHTSVGTVPGSDRAIFADDGSNLYFVTGNVVRKYASATLSTVSTGITSPETIDYIDSRFIVTGANGTWAVSDAGNGDSWDALNVGSAEIAPDALRRAYVFNQRIYMLGSETTEVWRHTGVGNPPLARQDTSLVNTGLSNKHAVTNTDQFLYWLGDDRKIYQCVGASARRRDSSAIAHIISKMTNFRDCIASAVHFEGQDFVVFTFPTENWTLVYSETLDYWTTLGSSTSYPGSRWLGQQCITCYDTNYVTANGALFELDLDTYTDNGSERLRIRTLPVINAELLGLPATRILVKSLRINMQMGVGLATGQGVNPVLMCSFSPDGGETYQAKRHVSMQVMGDYIGPVDFWDFCSGHEIRCRIECSDPVSLHMFDAVVTAEAAGY